MTRVLVGDWRFVTEKWLAETDDEGAILRIAYELAKETLAGREHAAGRSPYNAPIPCRSDVEMHRNRATVILEGFLANGPPHKETPHKLTRRPVQSDLWVKLGKGSLKPKARPSGEPTRFTVDEVIEGLEAMQAAFRPKPGDEDIFEPDDEPEGYQDNPYFYQEAVPIHEYLAAQLRRDRFRGDPVQFVLVAFNPDKSKSTRIADLLREGDVQFVMRTFPRKTYSE